MSAPEPLGERAAPKEDPEALELRGRRRKVVRFRRGMVIGMTGAVAVGVAAVTWAALEPAALRMAAEGERGEPKPQRSPDALAAAPADYSDVPQLGPPLPGDLGRPILQHRQRLEADPDAPAGDLAAERMNVRARAAEQAEQRRAAEREAARASAVLFRIAGDDPAARRDVSAGLGPAGREAAQRIPEASRPEMPWIAQTEEKVGGAGRGAQGSRTLSAGTVIPASLITGLNSDIAGTVIAQVTEHVRDSATGRNVLIPQGARLVGRHDLNIGHGQSRALVVWQRIVLPDGRSIELDDVPASDSAGYAGIEDRTDVHGWRLLKGVALSTLLGVGSELGLGSRESELVRAVREAAQQSGSRAGERLVERELAVKPTLRVRPGWPVRAVLHKDLFIPGRGN